MDLPPLSAGLKSKHWVSLHILTRNVPVSDLQSMKVIHKFPNRDFKGLKEAHVFKQSVRYLERGKTRPCKTSIMMLEMVKRSECTTINYTGVLTVEIFLLGILNTLKTSVY